MYAALNKEQILASEYTLCIYHVNPHAQSHRNVYIMFKNLIILLYQGWITNAGMRSMCLV